MAKQDKERWMQLCEQASTEQNRAKLMSLVSEINDILRDEEQRTRERVSGQAHARIASSDDTSKESEKLVEDIRQIVQEHRQSGY